MESRFSLLYILEKTIRPHYISFEAFYVEMFMRKKILLACIQNLHRNLNLNYLQEIDKNLCSSSSRYNFIFHGGHNTEPTESAIRDFSNLIIESSLKKFRLPNYPRLMWRSIHFSSFRDPYKSIKSTRLWQIVSVRKVKAPHVKYVVIILFTLCLVTDSSRKNNWSLHQSSSNKNICSRKQKWLARKMSLIL